MRLALHEGQAPRTLQDLLTAVLENILGRGPFPITAGEGPAKGLGMEFLELGLETFILLTVGHVIRL